MSGISVRIVATATVLATIAATVPLSFAQYFGRNKVQYEDLDFQVLRTEHFDVYFYPEEEEATEIAARMVERWYERFRILLEHELSGTQPLILYAAHPHFQQTNVVSGILSEGTGGVTESLKRRIAMPFAGPLDETDHVLGHELVHAFQYDILAANRSAANRMPLWFIEGMAEYLSVGPVAVMTATWLRQAAIDDELPTIEDLSDPRYFPYRFGHALWAYVAGRFGDEAVGRALKAAADGDSAIGAVERVTGMDAETLSAEWHRSIRETYAPLLESPQTASDFGRMLVSDDQNGGTLNVAPSLSPDGSRFVFLSERDLFSIDMYVGSAETGEVEESIVETATDPHFDSLQFIHSSGSWSPAGDRFVFAGISGGQPTLSFIDLADGDIVKEVEYPDLGEIVNPTWSPDGETVAFSAITGGLTDLYLLDVETERLQRLTQDIYADIHPDWSPSGDRLIFVTDRFSTDRDALALGEYHLATYEVSTGAIEPVRIFTNADHWDPQWTDTGIYFLSDYGGRPNIFRLDESTGRVHEVTSLSTGVQGITLLSPAFSVSSDGGRLLFTTREENEYRIYAMDGRELVTGRPLTGLAADDSDPAETWAAVLPPAPRRSRIAAWFDAPSRGLPAEASRFEVEEYDVDFSLDFVGQPYVAAGTSQLGGFLGGGVSFLWSDMLGNHQIGTQIQSAGNFEDIAGVAGYENRESRWYWGGSVSRIPFYSNQYGSGLAEVEGQLAQVEQLIQFRQTETRVGGYVAYPFSRVQRLELASGFTRFGFSRESNVFAVSLDTGRILVDDRIDLAAPDAINIGDSSAALVYDTSLLGPTSPVAGTRYRLQGGANYGGINFTSALADFRHYFMPKRPFTFATRVMHFGRYGGDAEDPRLSTLFLGFPNLVRGYQSGSFDADECRADGGCPVFDRLLGSRVLVANAELRFPLFTLFGADPWSGPFPIELAFFGDAGYAWRDGVTPDLFGGDQEPVTSAGVALRIPLQQFLTIELDYVRPFDRQRGWMFEWGIQQGF